MAARWRCALWSLVFVRLVLPVLPPSPLSLFNLLRSSAAPTVAMIPAPPQPAQPPRAADDEVVTLGVVPEAAPVAPAVDDDAPVTTGHGRISSRSCGSLWPRCSCSGCWAGTPG